MMARTSWFWPQLCIADVVHATDGALRAADEPDNPRGHEIVSDRLLADPEAAARKLMELAMAVEPVQDGRIHIEKINGQRSPDELASILVPTRAGSYSRRIERRLTVGPRQHMLDVIGSLLCQIDRWIGSDHSRPFALPVINHPSLASSAH